MNLDQRGWMVLRHIVDDPAITGKELEHQLNLSRKQLSYCIEKINHYLEDNYLPPIERLRTGKFNVSSTVINQYKTKNIQNQKGSNYTYSEKERGYLIIFLLLCSNSELSTYHFTSKLDISKNTLLLDLKKLQEVIAPYNIRVSYSRKDGYILTGSEYEKRELLIYTIRKILEIPSGRTEIIWISEVDKTDIEEMKERIGEIEQNLRIQFTDERLDELSYILYFVLLRIRNENVLLQLPEAFNHIVGTKEYTAMRDFTRRFDITEPLEKLYFTAQIQISNMSSFHIAGDEMESRMQTTMEKVIENFELICCVQIKEKKQLLEALIQHCKPAYYRIKYHYHIENSITDMILPQHNYLHEIVRKSIYPLKDMIEDELPEEELAYITLIFGSWLKREGLLDFIEERKRAVVLCANGVSVSNYLLITLRELLPEIEILGCMSIRDFKKNPYMKNEYNIVFTTERIETDKIQFLITPFLNEYSKQKFRQKVLEELDGVFTHKIEIIALLDIIEQHTTIHSKDQLIKSLNHYINASGNKDARSQKRSKKRDIENQATIQELLNEETVHVLDYLPGWKEVLQIGISPLLEKGVFEQRYLDRIIEIIETDQPFIMVAPGVVIAHAGVNDGVNSLGMALVKLPEKISVGGYMDADIVIILGTPNTTMHLGALYGMNELLEDEEKSKKLHQAETTKEIIALINSAS